MGWFSRFAKAPKPAEKRPEPWEEIASEISSALTAWKIGRFNEDEVVTNSQDGIKTYQKMSSEPEVKAALQAKKMGLLQRGWLIKPGGDEPAGKEIAAVVQWALERLPGSFHFDLWQALDALDCGYSIGEIVWGIHSYKKREYLVPDRIAWKDPQYYRFATDEFGNLLPLGLLQEGIEGSKEFPIAKFVLYSYLPRYMTKFGTADLRAAYKAWWNLRLAQRMRSVFLEKMALGARIGRYPMGRTDLKAVLLEALKSLQVESVCAMPQGVDVEAVELITTGAADAFRTTIQDLKQELRIAIVGSTLTASEGETGAMALGKVHAEREDDWIEFLARDTAEMVTTQLVRPIVKWNWNTVTESPWFEWVAPQAEIDRKAKAEGFAAVAELGVPVPVSQVTEECGIRAPEGDEPLIEKPKPAPNPFAPKDDQADQDDSEDDAETEDQSEEQELEEVEDESTAEFRVYRDQAGHRFASPRRDYAALETSLDTLLTDGMDAARPIFESATKRLERWILENWDSAMKDQSVWESFKWQVAKPLGVTFADFVESVWDAGRKDAMSDIRLAKKAGFSAGFSEPEFFAAFVPQVALEYFRTRALQYAGDVEDRLTEQLRELFAQAWQYGWTVQELIARSKALAEDYTSRSEVATPEVASAYRLERLFRTTQTAVFNGARDQVFNRDPGIIAFRYSSVLDRRTTDFCRAHDNVVRRKDDPEWLRRTPPNHWHCRGLKIPVYAWEEGVELSPRWPLITPDPGFGG